MAKKVLHPALKANADRLKRGEPIHKGGKKQSNIDKKSSTTKTKVKSAVSKTSATAKPKIRSKQKRG